MKKRLLIITLLPVSLFADNKIKINPAEEAQVVEAVECSQGSDVRRLEVFPRKAGCNLQYYKSGKRNEIAAYKSGVDSCREKLKNVRGNLEASGYKCK